MSNDTAQHLADAEAEFRRRMRVADDMEFILGLEDAMLDIREVADRVWEMSAAAPDSAAARAARNVVGPLAQTANEGASAAFQSLRRLFSRVSELGHSTPSEAFCRASA